MSDDDFPADKKTGTASFPVAGAVVHDENTDADEPMTEVQAARLRDLCEKHDEAFDTTLTREQADARIAALEKA
ncbi:DUF3072 domain-containing protein [Palleronia abyssalis]|uniref:DUF3072 domain-containing protein n=1 Tax=Palleronia abyssalis TaxID=1501240 RepID=A0A2R8BX24_9RHOB|nr:DUF3072 domain-containing protein [Palleronia abyssalis]SPJ24717.1 hypothetical protein PAA8504_02555 [Palleronia abyssalis]